MNDWVIIWNIFIASVFAFIFGAFIHPVVAVLAPPALWIFAVGRGLYLRQQDEALRVAAVEATEAHRQAVERAEEANAQLEAALDEYDAAVAEKASVKRMLREKRWMTTSGNESLN